MRFDAREVKWALLRAREPRTFAPGPEYIASQVRDRWHAVKLKLVGCLISKRGYCYFFSEVLRREGLSLGGVVHSYAPLIARLTTCVGCSALLLLRRIVRPPEVTSRWNCRAPIAQDLFSSQSTPRLFLTSDFLATWRAQ